MTWRFHLRNLFALTLTAWISSGLQAWEGRIDYALDNGDYELELRHFISDQGTRTEVWNTGIHTQTIIVKGEIAQVVSPILKNFYILGYGSERTEDGGYGSGPIQIEWLGNDTVAGRPARSGKAELDVGTVRFAIATDLGNLPHQFLRLHTPLGFETRKVDSFLQKENAIPLRLEIGNFELLATSISEQPVSGALLEVPSGYIHKAAPAGIRAGMREQRTREEVTPSSGVDRPAARQTDPNRR